jgi:hypothetical protein
MISQVRRLHYVALYLQYRLCMFIGISKPEACPRIKKIEVYTPFLLDY